MNTRINKLYAILEQQNLDVLVVTLPKLVYYFTDFMTEPHERFLALVCQRGEQPFLFVPALDKQKAEQTSKVHHIIAHGDADDAFALLNNHLGNGISRIGIQESHLNVKSYQALVKVTGAKETAGIDDEINRIRVIKSEEETARIQRAIHCIETVFRDTIPLVKPGVTELDLVAEIEYRMKKLGADGPSFETMVLTGEKTGLPHGVPGAEQIREGDLLLFDAGVFVDGYASDLTRTFAVGEIGDKKREIYDTVLRANRNMIDAVKPGTTFSSLDYAARETIANKGYGEWFITRAGHGFGLEIHEYPSIHANNDDLLREGMVFTAEPGIYIPAVGGVRIEDNVLVTKNGSHVLTTFPKDLMVIGCS